MNGAEITAAKQKLASGKSAAEVARELNLPASNVERLASKTSNGGLASSQHKVDGGLDKALAAAGFPTGIFGGAPAAPGAPGATPAVMISPEEIMALLGAVNSMILKTVVKIYQVPMTPKELGEFTALSQDEKDTLTPLAPFAARYAPAVMEKFPQIMAGAFCAVYLFSVGFKVYELRERAPRRLSKIAEMAPKPDESNGS